MGRIGVWLSKGSWEWVWDAIEGYYLRYAGKRITYLIFCHNLCCRIASENRILVYLVVYGCVERYALRLNQSSSSISKLFCKMETNSISQRRTQ